MTLFRPCIDIHQSQVKQIVGGTLRDQGPGPTENFVAQEAPATFAERYRHDRLAGGHVIMLGPDNDQAAQQALAAYPGGLQIGGGIRPDNAPQWLAAGASKVIVTSYLFDGDQLDMGRVEAMAHAVGPEHLVLDLSCRRVENGYRVATNRWQTITATPVDGPVLEQLAPFCSEFLVHAADVEGLCRGIDDTLVQRLGQECPLPCTYAGGGRSLDDLQRVASLSQGRLDLTFGSALDLFGGSGVRYADCVAWNRQHTAHATA